jgi:hypothetical protein
MPSSNALQDTFQTLEEELKTALSVYWDTACQILDTSSIRVLEPEPAYFTMEKIFFQPFFFIPISEPIYPNQEEYFMQQSTNV